MKYNYGSLNEQTFQELVQALIVADHPDAQCFPVAQPDGGRDALLYHPDRGRFVVFQVKFSRSPNDKRARDAIQELIRSEERKIRRLIERGATKYYFITNIQGTAHLDRGSIDRLNDSLREMFQIPCISWWRGELDRKLDREHDIKWSFPTILSATEILPLLVRAADDPRKLRSVRTVARYMATQYRSDQEIKFKQVDLKRSLVDLFVDLPFRRKLRENYSGSHEAAQHAHTAEIESYLKHFDIMVKHRSEEIDLADSRWLAAAFWLNMPLARGVMRFVLEGAPGQGKSTVTQFLSQVHRLRILRKDVDLGLVSDQHKSGAVRTPFRVDLRDYSVWIDGRHPFATGDSTSVVGKRSLESFLAMQVSWLSGDGRFTEDDFADFLTKSHCVIVLDGFDEVADIATRRCLVDEICSAASRFEVHAKSVQVIVTSRPAAFANSPGFPENEWMHLELKDLAIGNIVAYKEKWTEGQSLSSEDARSLSETLKEKLGQPHLRDLARNPMQLSILLHLMHAQGLAMPEKRTTLYEDYMRLFFNREAEKSAVVREHRELMLAIHGVLAWEMQTKAEQGKGSGSLSRDVLEERIRRYLESEEHDPHLVDPLFRGSVERVGALVSRVEGTFEFEVQPLREYFTARHLYTTASYSPAGRDLTGTKPQRFDALVRSSYWTNVTRFYCGFYDVGELGTLVDGFLHLDDQVEYRLINQPRRIALMLLSDHVFAQSPRTMNRLVAYITDEPAFERLGISQWNFPGSGIALPETAGRKVLFQQCQTKLQLQSDPTRCGFVRQVLRANADRNTLVNLWRKRFHAGSTTHDPFEEATDFGILDHLSTSEREQVTAQHRDSWIQWLAATGQYEKILSSQDLSKAVHRALFDGRLPYFPPARDGNDAFHLQVLSVLLRLDGFPFLLRYNSKDEPASSLIAQPWGPSDFTNLKDRNIADSVPSELAQFCRFVIDQMNRDVGSWQTDLTLWSDLVDRGFEIAPRGRLFEQLAAISTAVNADESAGVWSTDGFTMDTGLVSRLFYARCRAHDAEWWRCRLSDCSTDCIVLCMALLLSWCDAQVLQSLVPHYLPLVTGLGDRDWERLYSTCRRIRSANTAGESDSFATWVADEGVDLPRINFMLIGRVRGEEARRKLFRRAFKGYTGTEAFILQDAADAELITNGKPASDVHWRHVARISRIGRRAGLRYMFSVYWPEHVWDVPEDLAIDVLSNVGAHCGQFVGMCEGSFGARVREAASLVSSVAMEQKWSSYGD